MIELSRTNECVARPTTDEEAVKAEKIDKKRTNVSKQAADGEFISSASCTVMYSVLDMRAYQPSIYHVQAHFVSVA
jgi:hypothetical protein